MGTPDPMAAQRAVTPIVPRVTLQLGRIAPTIAHDAFRYVLSGE